MNFFYSDLGKPSSIAGLCHAIPINPAGEWFDGMMMKNPIMKGRMAFKKGLLKKEPGRIPEDREAFHQCRYI
jgi:hypothetical protein